MTQLMNERVQERLVRLRMPHVAMRLDALLSDAAKHDWTFLEFMDRPLAEKTEAKQRKRVTMGMQIAHFPGVKTMQGFDFEFQFTVDATLLRELATGRFVSKPRECFDARPARCRQNASGSGSGSHRGRSRLLGALHDSYRSGGRSFSG